MTSTRRILVGGGLLCAMLVLGPASPALRGTEALTFSFPAPPHPEAIGTQVGDINTYVSSVAMGVPDSVHRSGLTYSEFKGTVKGVGFGARGPTGHLTCHYEYELPFVLRIPPAWDGGLVVYRHGLGAVADWIGFEAALGEQNFGRIFHLSADRQVSDAALHPGRRWAFFAVNQTPVSPGGALNTRLLASPQCAAPVTQPVQSTQDVPIARDHALLAQRLMELLRGRMPSLTLGTGHSAGGGVHGILNAGIDRRTGSPLQVGDNHRIPYDPASGRIFDGFLSLQAGPAGLGGAIPAADLGGVSAPTIYIVSEADRGLVFPVNQLNEFALAWGTATQSLARLYMVRNMPHLDADFVWSLRRDGTIFGNSDYFNGGGDGLKPLTGAMLDALARWARDDVAPPVSVFNGEVKTGPDRIEFHRTSAPATAYPYVDDETLDTFVQPPPVVPTAAQRIAWTNVRNALDARLGSLVMPETSCRRASHHFTGPGPVGTWYVPFTEAAFLARWQSPSAHQACRVNAVDQLVSEGFYDPSVVIVDVLPNQFPNIIPAETERLEIAIFSTAGFDATDVVPGSLAVASASEHGRARHQGGVTTDLVDLDGDGRRDLVASFPFDRLHVNAADLVIDVWGRTHGGIQFTGTDVVDIQE